MKQNVITFIHIMDVKFKFLLYFHPILTSSSRFWLLLYNPWLTFSFFIQKISWIFIPFVARNFFGVLFGYMQPKKRTLAPTTTSRPGYFLSKFWQPKILAHWCFGDTLVFSCPEKSISLVFWQSKGLFWNKSWRLHKTKYRNSGDNFYQLHPPF